MILFASFLLGIFLHTGGMHHERAVLPTTPQVSREDAA